jgi:hypothetical protein
MNDKDITLPVELSECQLTPEEIGTIFVLYSIPKMSEDSKVFWGESSLFSENILELTRRGILKSSHNEQGETIMEIDISTLENPKNKFWVIDYDDMDNTIYEHSSHYQDEGSNYVYKLLPRLEDNTIIYSLSHSEFGVIEQYVSSLEEGEELVKLELEQELLNIKREDLKKKDVS